MKSIIAVFNKPLFFMICYFALQLPVCAQEIVIMTGEWDPFVSAKLKNKGFIAEIAAQACSAAGIKYSFEFAPWPRCEAKVRHGKAFAAFPYTPNEERAAFAYFSKPLSKARTVFFYNVNKLNVFNFSNFKALRPYLIGGVRGYYYEPIFKKNSLTVDYSDNEDDALKKLFFGRVDIMPLNELVGWNNIKRLYSTQIGMFATSKNVLDETDLNLMVSKKYPGATELLKRFNKGMEIIQKSSVYKNILLKNDVPLAMGCFIND